MRRARVALALLLLLAILAPVPAGSPARLGSRWGALAAGVSAETEAELAAPDPRYFPATRYRIVQDQFWDYFQRRGGLRAFGYPVSGQFLLFGLPTQIFQRQVLQLRPDGSVGTMNLLDDSLLPYTRINGSTFPAPDPALLQAAPRVGTPNYHAKALEFVKANAPDVWEGLPVRFYQTFLTTVRYEEAFPKGDGDPALMPGINLELWGLPTSRPAYDPNNHNFVYLRFQRGIMHYDRTTGRTQGLLLADYLKALLTGRDLPADLEAQAKGSRVLRQYDPTRPNGLARPAELPGTSLQGAFRRDPIVTIDPGHGGKQVGSSFVFPDGKVLQEKELTLRVAKALAARLADLGYTVVLTRTTDAQVIGPEGPDLTGDGAATLADDLQARIDRANAAGSDLFISVHFNGSENRELKGTQIFYSDERPFAERNKALAELLQANIVKALREAGYNAVDLGARTDSSLLGKGSHFYLLGPPGETIRRASAMPAALGEALFLTNPDDANALRQDRIVEAVVKGYVEGIKAYFARYPVQ